MGRPEYYRFILTSLICQPKTEFYSTRLRRNLSISGAFFIQLPRTMQPPPAQILIDERLFGNDSPSPIAVRGSDGAGIRTYRTAFARPRIVDV